MAQGAAGTNRRERLPPEDGSRRAGPPSAGGRPQRGLAAVPWLAVLCCVLAFGALIAWAVFAQQASESLLGALRLLRAPPAASRHLASIVWLSRTVVCASVSIVLVLLLTLATYRQQQRLKKAMVLTLADWPTSGCHTHLFVAASTLLLGALWLVMAVLVCLLCVTFTASAVAMAGDMAVRQARSTASSAANTTAAAAPAAVALMKGQHVGNTTAANACPRNCLDLLPVQGVLSGVHAGMEACVCSPETLGSLQQRLGSAWWDGFASCMALALLMAAASCLLLQGVASCVAALWDYGEAMRFTKQQQQTTPEQMREQRIQAWMRSSSQPHAGSRRDQQMRSGGGGTTCSRGDETARSKKALAMTQEAEENWPSARDTCPAVDIEQPQQVARVEGALREEELPTRSASRVTNPFRSPSARSSQQQH